MQGEPLTGAPVRPPTEVSVAQVHKNLVAARRATAGEGHGRGGRSDPAGVDQCQRGGVSLHEHARDRGGLLSPPAARRHEPVGRHLEQLLWSAAIPTATPADGAIETLKRLRVAGIHTAIVSYADIAVFEALLTQTRLAGLTDAEVCSEVARSCKPHPEIFHHALRTIGVDPSAAMFVGDDADTDIVGGNRIGMRTALVSGRQFTLGDGSTGDPEAQPDHHIDRLIDVVDLVIDNPASQLCA